MTRTDVSFPSGRELCAGWLYRPQGPAPDNDVPVIVMAHGLGAVKELRLDAFAERFRAAGYACLVFDYRHFGASGGRPRELLDIGSQLADWRAALTYARSLEGIDPNRVIVWGTSFGGGHALITAADDSRVAAVIAQCPFTDGHASGGALSLGSRLKIAPRALADLIAERLGTTPVRVATVGQPGSAALMTAPDAVAGHNALARASGREPAHTMIPARFALRITGHVPGRRVKDIACPALFVLCDHDSVAPARAASKWAATSSHAEVRRYDCGHFDIYLEPWLQPNITDQLDFLATHVPARAAQSAPTWKAR
ncbi:alpha/beta hydrolase [Nocardia nova]|uniref:alpha/beta hydrolase n=1 Tax=Nocardia nova TaxID=37330 RepID=UPI0033EF4B2D